MKYSIRFVVSIVLVFVFFFNSLPNVPACGPFKLGPVFSLTTHADFPLFAYTAGQTGIVPDSFGRLSLFVFYRELDNRPLSKAEQKQVVEAMESEIFYLSERGQADENSELKNNERPDYFDLWERTRGEITSEKTEIERIKRSDGSYGYFTNCLADAFKNATQTLEARIAKYGNTEPVKEWVKGQDAVFTNCGSEAAAAPEAPLPSFPEWLRRDREYQIAASTFYKGDFAAAREQFEKIAADQNSVWKAAAKLVAARTFIRQASFIENPEDEAAKAQAASARRELLQKAADKLQAILSDNSMTEYHGSAQRLLGLVKYRMIPDERRRELGAALASGTENQNLYDDLTDYAWLLDFVAQKAEEKGAEIDRQEAEKAGKDYDYNYRLRLRDVPPETRKDELTDWVLTYQAADGFQHAFEKWKETGRLQWFVAAFIKTESNAAQTAELLREADKIAAGSPAFATVRYHQIKLLLETGKRAEARQKLDEIIANNFKNLPLSAQNKFFAQRLTLAENLDDFLKFAPRKPVIFAWDEVNREEPANLADDENLSAWENRAMFDMDAVAFLNEKAPLAVLREAALSAQLPPHLKRFLVIAVWTRALMLGNQAIEREFTPLMTRSAKEFAPYFSKYAAAPNPAGREAAALVTVLRYPVIQPFVPVGFGREDSQPATIDSNRGNWWCTAEPDYEGEKRYDVYPFEYPKVYPDFLSAAQVAAADRERKQLLALGNSSTALARRAIEFANKNPNHPQAPEILHLAVRSTRYGCSDEQTGTYSKQAFDILHKRYPKSSWAKETPYWFN
jgi:hypothetical protein